MVGLLELPLDILKLICDEITWPVEQIMFANTCTLVWKNKIRLGLDCGYSSGICFHAAYFGHMNILKYCYQNGAPISPQTLELIYQHQEFALLLWIAEDMSNRNIKLQRKLKQYEYLEKNYI